MSKSAQNGNNNEFHSIAFNLSKAEDMVYYFKNIKVEIDETAITEPDFPATIQFAGIGNLVPKTYENINAWGGTWSGNDLANERDWSNYDYFWIKYKDFTGAINLGVMYSEWIAKQSWGDQFKDATVAIKDPSGVIGVKLDKESIYEKGNAEENGAYVGDIFAQHIREIFIQATAGGSAITIEEMWVGSEEDYLAAVEANKWEDPTVYADIILNGDLVTGDARCFFSKEDRGPIMESALNGGAIVVNSPAQVADPWDSQFWIRMPQALPAGTKYKVTFDCMASAATSVAMQSHREPSDYIGELSSVNIGTEWGTIMSSTLLPSTSQRLRTWCTTSRTSRSKLTRLLLQSPTSWPPSNSPVLAT